VAAPDDATLAYWNEQRLLLRQSETQRSVVTNSVLTIAAAVSGFVIQQHFRSQTLPLSVLVILTGLYGPMSAAKYHERARYHPGQAGLHLGVAAHGLVLIILTALEG
jgi:putative effector of murein hydrolase